MRAALGAAAVLGAAWVLTLQTQRRPSLPMRVAKCALPYLFRPAPLSSYHARPAPQPAPLPPHLQNLCTVTTRLVRGRLVYDLTPRHNASAWTVIYTHGGAYVNALRSNHWDTVTALIQATGATVTVPLYPLAPEHTFQAAYDLLEDVYRDVLTRWPAERVILCGDSAGAGLALGQALLYRERTLPLPGRLVLFAPWLDLTLTDPEIREVASRDVMLNVDALREMGRWWSGAADPRGPLLSPLHADLQGLPPTDVFIGTDDLFLVDARAFHRKALTAGVDVKLYETPGGFHVFMAAPWIPESSAVYGQLSRTLSRVEDRR